MGAWPPVRKLTVVLIAIACGASLTLGQGKFRIGRPVTEAELTPENYTVMPDGRGLPEGRGTATQGRSIFAENCETCHGASGEGKDGYPQLVGGVGTLASNQPVKTVGSYWPYPTTLFDYIRRAMPYDNPRSLSNDEVYAVAAFILSLDGIVEENQELNAETLPLIRMPNKDGFVPDPRPDILGPNASDAEAP